MAILDKDYYQYGERIILEGLINHQIMAIEIYNKKEELKSLNKSSS